jgi:hypothetical protein
MRVAVSCVIRCILTHPVVSTVNTSFTFLLAHPNNRVATITVANSVRK